MPSKRNTSNSRRNARRDNKDKQENSLREFFLSELKDIYWAEKHLVKELPKMEKAATTESLREAIAEHLEVTEQQVEKIEEIFEMLNERSQAKRCEAMEGITREGMRVVEETEKGSLTRDVAIIVAAQKIEHYEIAAYGGLAQIARTLGEDHAASVLDEILQEEKEADRMLTDVAEEHVNEEALMEEMEEGEE